MISTPVVFKQSDHNSCVAANEDEGQYYASPEWRAVPTADPVIGTDDQDLAFLLASRKRLANQLRDDV